MNILQVITPSRFSGAERVCVEVAEELRELGHHVQVVTKPNSHLAAALEARGVECHVTRIGGKGNVAAPLIIAGIARRMGADLIHTHLSTASLWGSVAGRLLGVPVITHVHALNTPIWYRGATHLVAVADAVRDHLVAHAIARHRISVVHNATDLGDLPPTPASPSMRVELDLAPDEPLIVVTAHLSPKKGHRVLLAALRILASRKTRFHCLCLGEGPELRPLQTLADRLGLHGSVRFLGFRDDARQIIQQADVVVLPSVRGEGLPLSLLEAAAMGKPAVATRLAGLPEIVVDGGTGYIVPPGDPDALAERLGSLLADASLRERMGCAARARAQDLFTRERRGRAIENVYVKILAPSEALQPRLAGEPHHTEPLERAVGRRPR